MGRRQDENLRWLKRMRYGSHDGSLESPPVKSCAEVALQCGLESAGFDNRMGLRAECDDKPFRKSPY